VSKLRLSKWLKGTSRGSGSARCIQGSTFEAAIPLLASPRGGVAARSSKCCEATLARADGVVFIVDSIGKPPRPREKLMLRDIFLDRSATPPCGDARRGICVTDNSRLIWTALPSRRGGRADQTNATLPQVIGAAGEVRRLLGLDNCSTSPGAPRLR
jgi:hypothetical protein